MRFEDHVRGRLVHERIEKLKKKKDKTWQMAMKYFEDEPRRLIEPDKDVGFEVSCPASRMMNQYGLPLSSHDAYADTGQIGISGGVLMLISAQVRDIFDPVIQDVLRLIDGRASTIRKGEHEVSAILLVDGSGGLSLPRIWPIADKTKVNRNNF